MLLIKAVYKSSCISQCEALGNAGTFVNVSTVFRDYDIISQNLQLLQGVQYESE